MSDNKLQPDSETFTSLIAISRDPDKADQLFKTMKARRLVIKRAVYITLANVHKTTGDYVAVKKIFEDMSTAGFKSTPVVYGIMLKTLVYNKTLTQSDVLREAENIFAAALSAGQAFEMLYVRMMEVLKICNAKSRADDLISDMRGNGLRIHPALEQEYKELRDGITT